ncbi:MAG: hypothetical protein HY791_12645 [Deltaproteobacteria bacterium]|nr:hypothetical protein [Deltaproteobacteria bacterium]
MLASACAPSLELAEIPNDAVGKPAVIIAERFDDQLMLTAARPAGLVVLSLAKEIFLLSYSETLETLGLEEGVLTRPSSDCRLGIPDSVSRMSPHEELVWVSSSLPDELRDRLVDDPEGHCESCTRFRVSTVPIQSSDIVFAGSWVRPGIALATYSNPPRVFLVTPEQVRQVVGCDDRAIASLLRTDERNYWAGSADGFLSHLELDADGATCVVRSSTRAPGLGVSPLRWIAGRSDPATDLYTLAQSGVVHHFDGQAFQAVLTLGNERGRASNGGLESPRAGEVIASLESNKVVHLKAGERYEREISTADVTLFSGVASIGGTRTFGPMLGASDGMIYVLKDEEWLLHEGSPAEDKIAAIDDYRGGVLATVEGGRVVQLHPTLGWCPTSLEIPGSRGRRGRVLIVDGDSALILGFNEGEESGSHGVWLERIP